MARIISECRPTWVLGENVPGIVTLALDGVLADLEGLGYSCQTFSVPACGKNSPHRRERIWIVGNAQHDGFTSSEERGQLQSESKEQGRSDQIRQSQGTSCPPQNVAHSKSKGRKRRKDRVKRVPSQCKEKLPGRSGPGNVANPHSKRGRSRDTTGEDAADAGEPSRGKGTGRGDTGPNLGDLVDGLPTELVEHPGWDVEPDIPRVSSGVKNRKQKLTALGNAIVPQVAHEFIRLMK